MKNMFFRCLLVLSVALTAVCIVGCGILTPQPKEFSSDGITITLDDRFTQTSVENYTVAFDSEDIAVFVLKEPFSLAEGFGDLSLDEYADLVVNSNSLTSDSKKISDDRICIEYDAVPAESGERYFYYSYLFKTDDAFWIVQFTTREDKVEKYYPKFEEWVKTVSFSD